MEPFSERYGFKKVRKELQIDSMDDRLRNRLWNALSMYYWDKLEYDISFLAGYRNSFLASLLDKFLGESIDILKKVFPNIPKKIGDYFLNCKWYEVYDFIEFVANNYTDKSVNLLFMEYCNNVLENELSAYRFVNGKITRITSEVEISEIEEVFENTNSDPLKSVYTHLDRALDLFSDREKPDYRNSVKESISAVEAICKLITGDDKATLSKALKKLDNKINIHPALKDAFNKLYGYTSDADGIRHSLISKESNLSFEEAKFMLVSCSAFVNYLICKAKKAGIQI